MKKKGSFSAISAGCSLRPRRSKAFNRREHRVVRWGRRENRG